MTSKRRRGEERIGKPLFILLVAVILTIVITILFAAFGMRVNAEEVACLTGGIK